MIRRGLIMKQRIKTAEEIKMNSNQETDAWSRRKFMKAVVSSSALAVMGQFGIFRLAMASQVDKTGLTMIVVDYAKCTGCRTCETACSAANHKQTVNGETLNGLGNPETANIRVYPYNPDVDVPNVCAMCPDNPCIEACPVDPDPKTGFKALFRHPETRAVTNDPNRCITCGSCADACRTGTIIPNDDTGLPEHMCTLCNGDPQCVKHCPFGALTHVSVDLDRDFYAMKPDQIAGKLIQKWYGKSH